MAALFCILAVVSLAEPRIYQFAVRNLIAAEAWCNDVEVTIHRVDGSLFEPLVLVDAVWHYRSKTGLAIQVDIPRVTAAFAWENLLGGSSSRCFQRLSLEGAQVRIHLPFEKPADKSSGTRWADFARSKLSHGHLLGTPALIEARGADLFVYSGTNFIRLQDSTFQLSTLGAGTLTVDRVVVEQSWLRKVFPKVHGTTALLDSKVVLADVLLEPGVELKNVSADLDKLARGSLKLAAALNAFGGTIQAEGSIQPHDRQMNLEASGNFAAINIAQLASFLSLSEAAGGNIKDGTFSFKGSPQNLAKSLTRVRLDAANFQWESRQWDSLVLGLDLRDRHLKVYECVLHQGHNELKFDGELTLPRPAQSWWQSDFNWNIWARIENLTELSALMLPEFTYAAGRVDIDGQIRGKGEKFDGKLDVNGSGLVWRNAPIDELHATLRLHENELRVSNLTVFNDVDSVRGHGVVNILGPTQYWGTLRASVADLGKYSAILQKPLFPTPLGGGALIDWSGEGSAKGHSGKFTARLNKLHSLGASAALRHPINAEADGSYASGSIVFSRFFIGDARASFTANIAVGNKAISLQGIQLYQNRQLTLEGDALLPLDLWKAWPDTDLDHLLDDSVQTHVALTARNLDLGPASQLTGWIFPVEGLLNATLTAEGPIGALQTSGQFSLAKATLPIGPNGALVRELQMGARFDGQTIADLAFTGRHAGGLFKANGSISLKNPRNPELHLKLQSERSRLPLFEGTNADAAGPHPPETTLTATLEFTVDGPASSPLVSGTVTPMAFQFGPEPSAVAQASRSPKPTPAVPVFDIAPLWASNEGGLELPRPFGWNTAPWNAWRFNLACRGSAAALAPVTALDLHIGGTGAAPELSGSASLRGLPLRGGDVLLRDSSIDLVWKENQPSVDARASGQLHGAAFLLEAIGPLRQPARFFTFDPPLTEPLLRNALSGAYLLRTSLETPAPLEFRAPAALLEGVEVFPWANPGAH